MIKSRNTNIVWNKIGKYSSKVQVYTFKELLLINVLLQLYNDTWSMNHVGAQIFLWSLQHNYNYLTKAKSSQFNTYVSSSSLVCTFVTQYIIYKHRMQFDCNTWRHVYVLLCITTFSRYFVTNNEQVIKLSS